MTGSTGPELGLYLGYGLLKFAIFNKSPVSVSICCISLTEILMVVSILVHILSYFTAVIYLTKRFFLPLESLDENTSCRLWPNKASGRHRH